MSRIDAKTLPSQEYLQECFNYDQETGSLTWRRRPVSHYSNAHRCNNINARFAGAVAGNETKRGYRLVNLDGEKYLAHRIIWKLMTGQEPTPHVDHRDTNPRNNRWMNLRPATKQQNGFNRPAPRVNKTGFKGVSWDSERQRFAAFIRAEGRSQFLGRFDTKEEAGAAYQAAARKFQGDYANT